MNLWKHFTGCLFPDGDVLRRLVKVLPPRFSHSNMDDNLGIPNLAARQLRSRDIIRLEAGKTQRPASPRASPGGASDGTGESQVT